MTVKLVVLKSGEDIIADVSEMVVGEDDNPKVVGYFLDKPCIIKMRNPSLLNEESSGGTQKAGYEVSLFPWIPLSAEKRIPVPADWVVTMVEPTAKLKEMYIEDVVNYGQNNQTNNSDEQGDTNLSD